MFSKNEDNFFIFDREKPVGFKRILLTLLDFLKAIIFRIVLLFSRKDIAQKEYYVSICAIFKNEAPYLREWIEFHKLIGIEHFYLYNNNSTDDYEAILAPYIKDNLVTLVHWPMAQGQIVAYQDCIKRYSNCTNWLGFIDIDEFIVPNKMDNISVFLRKFEKNAGSVLIYWKFFGTSGLLSRDVNNCVSEDFTVTWNKYADIGKCFYNTAFDNGNGNISSLHHKFYVRCKGLAIPPVNAFNHICPGRRNKADSEYFPIQINHYFTKSFDEYKMKVSRGDVFFKDNPHDIPYFLRHEMKCTSTDHAIYKYLIELKLALKDKN